MRSRGEIYWLWADAELSHQAHIETLPQGLTLEILVRFSRQRLVQLFMGVYRTDGRRLFEEYHDRCDAKTLSRAMLWGLHRARVLASGQAVSRRDSLPRQRRRSEDFPPPALAPKR